MLPSPFKDVRQLSDSYQAGGKQPPGSSTKIFRFLVYFNILFRTFCSVYCNVQALEQPYKGHKTNVLCDGHWLTELLQVEVNLIVLYNQVFYTNLGLWDGFTNCVRTE